MIDHSFSISNLIDQINREEIRLPEMQRGYVWSKTKVRDLLDSLYRGYPSGTILTWKTDEDVPIRKMAVPQKETTGQTFQLLLDGQQRLTSLSAVIRGKPVNVKGRKKPIEILFNLKHPDEPSYKGLDEKNDAIDASKEETQKQKQAQIENMVFAVKRKSLEQIPHWVSVTKVFQTDNTLEFLITEGVINNLNDPNTSKYNQRLNDLRKIENYQYKVHELERKKSYQEVAEIFVRVNSLGTTLTGSDLAQAQITSKWKGSLIEFEAFQKKCAKNDFDLDLGIIVRNLISFATGQSNSKNLPNLKQAELEKAWGDSIKGFSHTIDFIKSNLNIVSPALLSSPYILIALAYFFHHHGYHLSAKDEKKLKYWILIANAKGHYSRGAIYTFLDQDLKYIREMKQPNEALDVMIKLLDEHFGLLIKESDLINKNSRNAYFKTMFLVFHKDGAKDWDTRLAMSLKNVADSNKLQFHHIFPQSQLKGKQVPQKINDICNLAFIGARTNNKINNEFPSVYLPNVGADLLNLQQVPTDADLWEMDKYDKFLAERRKMVVARLNEFLDHESIK